MSLSSRRAWIEIRLYLSVMMKELCRSPHGERGLKCDTEMGEHCGVKGRSPHGERGLKFIVVPIALGILGSLSSRRAWIEIQH